MPTLRERLQFGLRAMLAGLLFSLSCAQAADSSFEDRFQGRLAEGWTWVREHRDAWRVTARGLEVRVQPGNMWGAQNNAKNVLVRPLPETTQDHVAVSVTVENRPTEQYEQANLVWYYDDSHMVKIGLEQVDGKLCIVMGREQADRTRTIAIIPIDFYAVRLEFRVENGQIRGRFRALDSKEWREAGACDLPAPENGPNTKPKISLQFYQGPAHAERWARAADFQIERVTN